MLRILLADDDKFFQKLYSSKLTQEGFEVIIASDGEEALVKMREAKPDVLLLDMVMPKKDGFEVLEELAADEILKTIPVLVLSTLGQESDIEKAKSLGARNYINKSDLDFASLCQKIFELTGKN